MIIFVSIGQYLKTFAGGAREKKLAYYFNASSLLLQFDQLLWSLWFILKLKVYGFLCLPHSQKKYWVTNDKNAILKC